MKPAMKTQKSIRLQELLEMALHLLKRNLPPKPNNQSKVKLPDFSLTVWQNLAFSSWPRKSLFFPDCGSPVPDKNLWYMYIFHACCSYYSNFHFYVWYNIYIFLGNYKNPFHATLFNYEGKPYNSVIKGTSVKGINSLHVFHTPPPPNPSSNTHWKKKSNIKSDSQNLEALQN